MLALPGGRSQQCVRLSEADLARRLNPTWCFSIAANRNVLEALWTNFNAVADGFGLNLAVFQTICGSIEGLRVTTEQCQKLFAAFDTDQVTGVQAARDPALALCNLTAQALF